MVSRDLRVYVRYSDEPVCRTIVLDWAVEHCAIDIDRNGRIIGVELLDAASVELDGSRVATINGKPVATSEPSRDEYRPRSGHRNDRAGHPIHTCGDRPPTLPCRACAAWARLAGRG